MRRPIRGRLSRPPGSRFWFAEFRLNGKRVIRSTRTSDQEEARAILADLVRDLTKAQESPYLFPRAGARGQYFDAKPGRPLLTRAVYALIARRARAILGLRLGPHTLRHTCASYALYHGAQLETIQRFLGHEDIRTTMIYLHVPQQRQEEELARIFGRN
jgi:integrase